MSIVLQNIISGILSADQEMVVNTVQQGLDEGLDPEVIMKDGLIAAMGIVGERFEEGNFFVPEMLVSARVMKAGLMVLKPHFASDSAGASGKVVLGTVQGDLHDIGKNLVGIMLEGAGFEVIDLGTNISAENFIKVVQESGAQVVGMSAMLTTTMASMQKTIVAFEETGIRDQVKIMVGGAPLTDGFAKDIGADGFAADANRAVDLTKLFSNS